MFRPLLLGAEVGPTEASYAMVQLQAVVHTESTYAVPLHRGLAANPSPQPPLLPPIRYLDDASQFALGKPCPTHFDQRQVENLLLDVGREQEQIHDLSQPCTGHLTESSELGLAGDLAG